MSETRAFQSEVTQLLNLMIHSLYSEREIFLRELISNASDACDKLRFQALTQQDLLKGDDDLRIDITHDAEAGTLTIADNGIGMTRDEAIANLGTIAKSGTKEFFQQAGDAAKGDLAGLIGQFGVGFYSSFMVADKVVVETRSAHASSDEGVRWESNGDGNYELDELARPQRGTTITLYLKDDAKEFAEGFRLRHLIKRYSDYVTYPVRLPEQLSEEDRKEGKTAEMERVNATEALWTRPKSEISDEQYAEFYKSACRQWDEPATRVHFSVEGTIAFTALLFVPSQQPMDLFDRQQRGLSLYVRRVFIMDDCQDLLPEYLRFVRGVVDSDDLPLNVSRELLQQQSVVQKLRKQLTKRILDHLATLAASADEDERATFVAIEEQFGQVLREGIVNDFETKEKLLGLARYHSTWTRAESDEERGKTGLAAYKERMAEGQEKIYFITAPTLSAAEGSPLIDGYVKKGFEVLFLTDPVDEWVGQHLSEFDGTTCVNIARNSEDLDSEEDKQALEEAKKDYEGFLGFCQEQVGGIKEVRLSKRLGNSPCALVDEAYGSSPQMVELMRRMGQDVPDPQRILELNPDHAIVQKLKELHGKDAAAAQLPIYVQTLRDQAVLAEGGRVPDPGAFARQVQQLLLTAIA